MTFFLKNVPSEVDAANAANVNVSSHILPETSFLDVFSRVGLQGEV